MKKKVFAILLVLALALSLAACGAGEETTLTGMVVSVDGTVITLAEMDADSMGGKDFSKGERPEGMEGFEGVENFNPEAFEGTLPEGETFPQRAEGERPEMPEGMELPEDMELPEGMTIPENGERPSFEGGNGEQPDFGNFTENMETTQIDIGDAHISVEEDGVKASGSLTDLKTGAFVTITKDGKGKVTNVLVTSSGFSGFGGFGGGFRGGNFEKQDNGEA